MGHAHSTGPFLDTLTCCGPRVQVPPISTVQSWAAREQAVQRPPQKQVSGHRSMYCRKPCEHQNVVRVAKNKPPHIDDIDDEPTAKKSSPEPTLSSNLTRSTTRPNRTQTSVTPPLTHRRGFPAPLYREPSSTSGAHTARSTMPSGAVKHSASFSSMTASSHADSHRETLSASHPHANHPHSNPQRSRPRATSESESPRLSKRTSMQAQSSLLFSAVTSKTSASSAEKVSDWLARRTTSMPQAVVRDEML
jgi:hypothetical protein